MAAGDAKGALSAYEKALEIHPQMPVRDRVEALREQVEGEKL